MKADEVISALSHAIDTIGAIPGGDDEDRLLAEEIDDVLRRFAGKYARP